ARELLQQRLGGHDRRRHAQQHEIGRARVTSLGARRLDLRRQRPPLAGGALVVQSGVGLAHGAGVPTYRWHTPNVNGSTRSTTIPFSFISSANTAGDGNA